MKSSGVLCARRSARPMGQLTGRMGRQIVEHHPDALRRRINRRRRPDFQKCLPSLVLQGMLEAATWKHNETAL